MKVNMLTTKSTDTEFITGYRGYWNKGK
jgi:hypothetical protein